MVSSTLTWWGGASSRRDPSSMPAGYANHTGYQYDSISRVAGQRELAPPSNLSKEGGCRKSVFKGIPMILPERPDITLQGKRLRTGLSKSSQQIGSSTVYKRVTLGFQLQIT